MTQLKPKPLMYDPADEGALNRLRLLGGPLKWNVMNWFVQLAKKDLTKLTQGDFLSLQEEADFIRRSFCHDYGAKPSTMEELSRLQKEIRKHLNDLIAVHQLTLGLFRVNIEINLSRQMAEHDS